MKQEQDPEESCTLHREVLTLSQGTRRVLEGFRM